MLSCLFAAESIESAEFFQRGDVSGDFGQDAILRELFADGAIQAFGGRAAPSPTRPIGAWGRRVRKAIP